MSKAQNTRFAILQKAFELIYVKGYQATSIDDILANTNVTKGAFYYHFKNKDEMGLALINEFMQTVMKESFISSLPNSNDPVNDIYKVIHYLLMENPFLKASYGCPAGNLTQEMSPINEMFNESLANLVNTWQNAIETNIKNGKKHKNIRQDVSPKQVAYFVMSGYWGIRNFGKLYGKNCYKPYLKELRFYLNALK